MTIKSVGILGSGIMGSGIAEVAAKTGHTVILRSRKQESADAMVAALEKSLTKQVERGKLAEEEMRHFREVYAVLLDRGVRLGRDPGDPYARALFKLLRSHPRERKLDRLLVAALIEERSCERFGLLRAELEVRGEDQLANQFRRLQISEAGHATLFVRLASDEFGDEGCQRRLDELATLEAEIVAGLPIEPRIH